MVQRLKRENSSYVIATDLCVFQVSGRFCFMQSFRDPSVSDSALFVQHIRSSGQDETEETSATHGGTGLQSQLLQKLRE